MDPMMDENFRIRRHAGALFVPGGAMTVATLMALALAATALLVPIAWLERIGAQIGLSTWMPDAVPPFDFTERLLFAIPLGLLGALLGAALARAFRVADDGEGWARLLERLRGISATADEVDAPRLNPLDRHPDAPARRPLSPLRDLVPSRDADAFDADELLLDTPAPIGEPQAEPIAPVMATNETWFDGSDEAPVVETPDSAPAMDLTPPTLTPEPLAAEPVTPEPVAAAPEAVVEAPRRAPRPPIDLSVERLDSLVARLEAGAARREAALAGASHPLPPADDAEPADAEEAALLNDPALAAALRTLRRMNAAA